MIKEAVYTPSAWQQEAHACDADEMLGAGSAGVGKAIAVRELVPTPAGWKRMGDVHVGDHVFSENGMPVAVLGESPVMTGRECFKVVFDDGSSVVVDGEHLWKTMAYKERCSLRNQEKRASRRTGLNDQRHRASQPQVRTTVEIRDTLCHGGRVNHAVMNTRPVQAPTESLPVPPYILGIWLGDGTKGWSTWSVATMDQEVAEAVADYAASLGCTVTTKADQGKCPQLSVVLRQGKKNPAIEAIRALFPDLRDGDYGIPSEYMFASEAQRRELLDGLVDSDGHVAAGKVEVCFCHERLAKDTAALIASLGLKPTLRSSAAKLYGRVVGTRWRIHFSNQGQSFGRIARKRNGGFTQARTSRWRYIVAVEPVASEPVKCILVDSPTHLFLVGERFIPTHNTLFLITDPIQQIQVEHERCVARERWAKGKGPKPLHGLKWGASVGWALHLRRELIDLQQTMAVAARIYKAVDPDARWDAQNHTWIFKSGYRLTFGHCQNLDSHTRYLSFSFTWIGFDELTTFALEQYDGVTSRLRTSDPVLIRMLRVRACTNPGSSPGSDPLWVRKLWIDPCPEGRRLLARKLRMLDGTERTRTRVFLPGRLSDNPDPLFRETYELTLQDKPKHMREAYLNGDWYYIAGSYFGDDFLMDVHVLVPFMPPSDWPVWRSMDWGFKTAGIVGWFTMDEDGNEILFAEWWFSGQTDREVAEVIKFKEQRLGLWNEHKDCSLISGPADTQLWEKRGEHDTMSKAEKFAEMGIDWVPADKADRAGNAQRVIRRMRDHRNRTTYPGLSFTSDCVRTIKCIRTIPTAKNPDGTPKDEPAKGADDHPCDMVMYSCAYASRGREAMPQIRRGRSILDEIELHRHKGGGSGSGTGYGSQYG